MSTALVLQLSNIRDDSFDLTLFWKSKAENLPELYKLASCYCTTTIGSYDVERSFSAYSAILDEKRRSLDESTIKAFHFLNLNLQVQNSNKQEREQHRTTATCTTNRVTPNESSVPGKARSKSQEVTAPENPLPGEAREFPRLFNNQKKRSQHLQRQRTPVPMQKVRKTGQRTKERKLTSLISNSPRQCTKGRKEVIPLGLSIDLPWIHIFRSGRKQIPKQAVMSLLRTFNIHQLLG